MKYKFAVPHQKQIRVIINTDAKNEADDQYAIVHALLTPRFQVKGIIGAHFAYKQAAQSMKDSVDEVLKLVDMLNLTGQIPVLSGAPGPMPDEKTPIDSEGARFIIEEAMKEDSRPLYVLFIGTLTDLASAYLLEPRIADKMTAVWVGGGTYPDGHPEFNLMNDIHSGNVVFGSQIPLWQVPLDVAAVMKVSLAELQYRVEPYGEVGKYLFDQLIEVNDKYADVPQWPDGESWILWDSVVIGLLLDEHKFFYKMKPAPAFSNDMHYIHHGQSRGIRVYTHIESRFIMEDFYAKLALYAKSIDKGVGQE